MATRHAVGFIVGVAFAAPVHAQTPTVPPTLDFTCHGYVEAGGTRAYNCIPSPAAQRHMRTFVPAPGSPCTEGAIDEFPPGRIVFQIRCRDSGGTTPPTTTAWSQTGSGPAILDVPLRVQRVRITGEYDGYGENFVIWCGVTGDRGALLVNEILGTSAVASGTTYSGVHSTIRAYGGRGQHCRELQVEHSVGIDWTVTEVAAPMLVPPERTLTDDLEAVERMLNLTR